MTGAIATLDQGRPIEFSFEDMLAYHGPGSPGGVAHAFKVLERGLALLEPAGPPERRQVSVRTAFGGPGARDGFELVTRAVTDGRYLVDPDLARPDRGRVLERFAFRLSYREREVTLLLRPGYVTEEFIDLARAEQRSEDEESRLALLKIEMAERLMSSPAADVYDVDE